MTTGGGQLEAELSAYVEAHESLPASMLLGHLVFFTVREADYDRQAIAGWLLELGLDTTHLPRADTALNAFRTAARTVHGHTYDLPGGGTGPTGQGTTGRILVRSLDPDGEGQTRLLVREVRASKKALRHDTVAEVRFYRASTRENRAVPGSERLRTTMHSSTLLPGEHVHVRAALAGIEAAYRRSLQHIGGMKIRHMFRGYLHQFEAVMLHQSTYFVHISHEQELAALHELATRMGCRLNRLPLMALPETRQMLVEAVETDTVTELERLCRDSAALRIERGKVSPVAYRTIKGRFDLALGRAAQYAQWLDTSLDEVGMAADVALVEVEQLRKGMES